MLWKKLSKPEIKERVFAALDENRNYDSDYILGIPGSYLDTGQFHRDADFLADAPYLKTFINNPNHIGCHTLTGAEGEDLFRGTQKLEIELIRMVSEEILKAKEKSVDGYVSPGGTEANIQAVWIYRNFFRQQRGADLSEIALVFSEDSHYSFFKAANLLSVEALPIPVHPRKRSIERKTLEEKLRAAKAKGLKYVVLIANMSTTMFGSVDDPGLLADTCEDLGLEYQLHVDGAFGGFLYPFTNPEHKLDFRNPRVNSITLDAHKMLMAPYGTGIFLIRKNWMHYAATNEASYVQGLDYTLVGSRNGAQAVSIWMILQTYGPEGWKRYIDQLMAETERICDKLKELAIPYYRHPHMNIISIEAHAVPKPLTTKYRLVADTFEGETRWWKIVVMPHTMGKVISSFLADLEESARKN